MRKYQRKGRSGASRPNAAYGLHRGRYHARFRLARGSTTAPPPTTTPKASPEPKGTPASRITVTIPTTSAVGTSSP